MPKFVTFFSYTSESMQAMIERPSDRSAAANALVESLGGKLLDFYWMQGHHDGFLITELADSVSAAALAMAVGSTGAIKSIETHELFDADDQAKAMRRAAEVKYRPPTG